MTRRREAPLPQHGPQRSQRKGWLRNSGALEVPQNARRLVPAQTGGPCRAGSKLHPHLQRVEGSLTADQSTQRQHSREGRSRLHSSADVPTPWSVHAHLDSAEGILKPWFWNIADSHLVSGGPVLGRSPYITAQV